MSDNDKSIQRTPSGSIVRFDPNRESPLIARTLRDLRRPPLPEGFTPIGDDYDAASGYPMWIRCLKDNSEMVLVPAGKFLMGEDKKPLYLEAYYIDVYPVTNGQYERFVKEVGYPLPCDHKGFSQYWDKYHNTPYPETVRCPVVCVNWHDALAYCKWVSKRLPTAEEWEKAARGTDGRIYPWGDDWDASKCHWLGAWESDPNRDALAEVGSYSNGMSPYGCHDMVGNVIELTASGDGVTIKGRGGSWMCNHPEHFRCAALWVCFVEIRCNDRGFRCALSPHDV